MNLLSYVILLELNELNISIFIKFTDFFYYIDYNSFFHSIN